MGRGAPVAVESARGAAAQPERPARSGMSCALSGPGFCDFSPDGGGVGDKRGKIGLAVQRTAARSRQDCQTVQSDGATGNKCWEIRPPAIDQAVERIYLKPGANNQNVSATYTTIRNASGLSAGLSS